MGNIPQEGRPFLNFQHGPFSNSLDVPFYDAIRAQETALEKIRWAIYQRKGILTLSGLPGTGKTAVLVESERTLGKGYRTALLRHPPTDSLRLIEHLLLAFKIPIQQKKPGTFSEMLRVLQDFVIEIASMNQHVVIFIDNAHFLSDRSLEFIRLFSNLMTERQRLMTIVLGGRAPFVDKLNRPEMRQFVQRIFINLTLGSLSPAEMEGYLKHHLAEAGGANEVRFDTRALSKLYRCTDGNPKKLNVLASDVLRLADQQRIRLISEEIVRQAYKETTENAEEY